jgi:hypothetical protein
MNASGYDVRAVRLSTKAAATTKAAASTAKPAATTAASLALCVASALGGTSLSILHVLVQGANGRLSAGPVKAARRGLWCATGRPIRS